MTSSPCKIRRFSTITFMAFAIFVLAGCASVPQSQSGLQSGALAPGKGTFNFDNWAGPDIRVWYQLPDRVTEATPVVFVMHGRGRDADRYRDEWSGLAARHGYILIVPEFDNDGFPGSRSYNHGNFAGRNGEPIPRERWSFSAIEPLFDEVLRLTGAKVDSYGIYGHSAGAQFVHRFALFMPEARYHVAVSANAGSYAMPDLDVDYPFGLAGAPVTEADLRAVLGKPLMVLLGTADNDPNHRSLPDAPAAQAQGPHRLARGQAFVAAGEAAAGRLGVPFDWQVSYVEGVGHKNGEMAVAAAELLGK